MKTENGEKRMTANREKGMRRFAFFASCCAAAAALCACGHNTLTYGDGVGMQTTLNPETYSVGVHFFYGKILHASVKEKTTLELEAGVENSNGSPSGTVSTVDASSSATNATRLDTRLVLSTGDQVTGYAVDLEKAKNAASAAE